jgi:hypothetical protein
MGNACSLVVGNHERKRQLGRLRPGWEDNIKMIFFFKK